jgi:hypothetical protein
MPFRAIWRQSDCRRVGECVPDAELRDANNRSELAPSFIWATVSFGALTTPSGGERFLSKEFWGKRCAYQSQLLLLSRPSHWRDAPKVRRDRQGLKGLVGHRLHEKICCRLGEEHRDDRRHYYAVVSGSHKSSRLLVQKFPVVFVHGIHPLPGSSQVKLPTMAGVPHRALHADREPWSRRSGGR